MSLNFCSKRWLCNSTVINLQCNLNIALANIRNYFKTDGNHLVLHSDLCLLLFAASASGANEISCVQVCSSCKMLFKNLMVINLNLYLCFTQHSQCMRRRIHSQLKNMMCFEVLSEKCLATSSLSVNMHFSSLASSDLSDFHHSHCLG